MNDLNDTTVDCVRPTQSSVIQIIHSNVDLKCFFSILPKLSLHMHISFIFHKVVLRRIYGVVGYIIITLLQIVHIVCQQQNFENQPITGEDLSKI